MNTHVIAPGADMIDAVIALLEHEGVDYTPNLVVFQGKRPAHVLRKRLAERTGGSILPPVIHSADGFIDYLYVEKLNRTKHDVTDLDAAGILLELQDQIKAGAIADDRNRRIESFLPFGMKIFQELEEVKIGNVSPPQLDIRINSFLDQYDVKELLYLRDFYRLFYDRIQEEKRSTRATRYAEVAHGVSDIDLSEHSRIIIAGYASPNPSERVLFTRLAAEENVHFIFQDAEGLGFVKEQFDGIHPGDVLPSEKEAPAYHLYESSDAHGQLFALSALLKDLGEEPDERTVIVVSKPESLFPLLSYGVGHIPEEKRNVSLGYPFNRTPVYEFIMALMRTLSTRDEGRYFAPAYLDFILHPYTKNILFGNRADVTRILLHTIEEVFFTDSSATLFDLDGILATDAVFERAVERLAHLDAETTVDDLKAHLQHIHESTLLRVERSNTIGELARTLEALLRFVYENSTARNHPFVLPFMQTAIEEMQRLAESQLASHAFDDMAAYERLLKRTLGGVREPFPGTPLRGLQILGLLETRSLNFDRVIVLDANEDALPGGRGADMLLPQRIRDDFGLMTYKLQDRLSEHYFHLLCQGAKEVHLMYRTGNGMERSRFVEQIMWKLQKERGEISESGVTRSIQYNVNLRNGLPGAIEKTTGMLDVIRNRELSPSAIDTYLHCPLKYYYSYVLSLRKQEDVTGEMESMEIGKVVHRILELYFEPFIGKPFTRDDIDTELITDLTRQKFAASYGERQTGEVLLIRQQVERRLQDFLVKYQLPLAARHSIGILGLEEEIRQDINGVAMKGYLDRVETRDGIVHIIDYKTGGSLPSIRLKNLDPGDRTTWSRAVGSVQLPMYIKLYAAKHNVDPDAIIPLYVHLGRSQIDGKTEKGIGKDMTSSAEWYPALEEVIDGLVEEIHDVSQPFYPPEDPARACTYCEFKTTCGTRWLK